MALAFRRRKTKARKENPRQVILGLAVLCWLPLPRLDRYKTLPWGQALRDNLRKNYRDPVGGGENASATLARRQRCSKGLESRENDCAMSGALHFLNVRAEKPPWRPTVCPLTGGRRSWLSGAAGWLGAGTRGASAVTWWSCLARRFGNYWCRGYILTAHILSRHIPNGYM